MQMDVAHVTRVNLTQNDELYAQSQFLIQNTSICMYKSVFLIHKILCMLVHSAMVHIFTDVPPTSPLSFVFADFLKTI